MFFVSEEALTSGWAAPENFKPFASFEIEAGLFAVTCRKWHRGEDRVQPERATAEFDADHEETIRAHEFEGDARDFLPSEAFDPLA